MSRIIKFTLIASVTSLISACGGGGGGSAVAVVKDNAAREIKAINASNALANFILTNRTWSDMESNDGSLSTASLFVSGSVENIPFVASGSNSISTFSRQFQLQLTRFNGTRGSQYIWKIIFDADGKPLGVAATQELNDWDNRSCLAVSSFQNPPVLSNGSGQLLAGNSGSYYEDFRSGLYANYCDVSIPNSTKNAEWSVADGDPNPYICLTFPSMFLNPKTRICISTNVDGSLTGVPWIRTYRSDEIPATDYKTINGNKPNEYFSENIDPNNYWYGVVRRYSDGYVYQEYKDSKFSSELACKNQTKINWKDTWSAINQTWSCVNIKITNL